MKQPWWKMKMSYVYDFLVERASSDINEVLEVYYCKGQYQLCTDRAIYSYGSRYKNYFDTFKEVQLPPDNSDVLILGLGLGSIPYMLENDYHKKYQYTAVEIDEEVVYLASKYVLDELQSHIEVINTDASIFMSYDQRLYDMITLDIFLSDVIPEVFLTHNFMENLRDSLVEGGMVVMNTLYYLTKDKQQCDLYFDQVFSKIFKKNQVVMTEGNKILVGYI